MTRSPDPGPGEPLAQGHYPHVTPTSRRLLEHWTDPERDNPVLQREAAETAIFLAEAAVKCGDVWIRNTLDAHNSEHNDGLARVALKVATGSGKTVVMAMLIAWQAQQGRHADGQPVRQAVLGGHAGYHDP